MHSTIQCDTCRRYGESVAWCHAEHKHLCIGCYMHTPGAQYVPPKVPVVKLDVPPRYKASVYETFFARVYDRLKSSHDRQYVAPAGDGTGRIGAWCPICHTGLISVQVVNGERPTLRVDDCTAGCTAKAIARWVLA